MAGRAVREFFADGCPQRAAAISYYALLSLFPLAILAVAGIGLVVDDAAARDRVVETVLSQLPLRADAGAEEIGGLLREITAQRGTFGLVGAVGLVFAASGVMGAIRHAFNAAWDVQAARPLVQGKLLDILLVLGFGALVALSFAATLLVRLTDRLTDLIGAGSAIDGLIASSGRLLPALMALATFAVLFRVVPARHTPWRDIWPGVLTATLGYELAKSGFALYLEGFARYGTIYASLGTAVAFMVFIFIAANIALLGAEVASEWPGVRDGRPDDDKVQGSLRDRIARAVRRLFISSSGRPRTADGEDGPPEPAKSSGPPGSRDA